MAEDCDQAFPANQFRINESAIAPSDERPHASFAPVSAAHHVFRWLASGAETFESMLQSIEHAQHTIMLEFYICKAGAVSDRFRTALIAACERGVRVRLLLDAFGSDGVAGSYWREFEQCGGNLRWFNPLRILRATFRNHRKLLVTDDMTAVVTSLNLADEYDGDGVSHGWRDLALEVRGPLVKALSISFMRMWALARFDRVALTEFARAGRRFDQNRAIPELLLAGPGCRTADFRGQLYADLEAASHVDVHAPYFLPSRQLGALLKHVALRGQVRILMPANSDVALAQLATWHAIRRMNCDAIRLFEYLPRMIHSKLLLIDDIVYMGSANLDVRSRLINYELMLRLPVSALAEQARGIFEGDLQHSRPASIVSSSWWLQVRQRAAYWLLARLDPYVASRKLRMLQ